MVGMKKAKRKKKTKKEKKNDLSWFSCLKLEKRYWSSLNYTLFHCLTFVLACFLAMGDFFFFGIV